MYPALANWNQIANYSLKLALILLTVSVIIIHFVNFFVKRETKSLTQVIAFASWVPLGIVIIIMPLTTLFGLWLGNISSPYALGGVIPWSDAGNYLHGARSFVEWTILPEWSCRRPIHTILLGTMLGVVNQNLFWVHLVLAALISVSTLFAVLRTRQIFGNSSAIVMSCGLLFYIQPFVGTTLSELSSYIFGCLGYAWAMRLSSSSLRVTISIFFISLALLVRPGALFLIPLLLLPWKFFGGYLGNRKPGLASLSGLLGLIVAFAVLARLNHDYCERYVYQKPFSNFVFSLYGIAAGAQPYSIIFQDHPELSNLADGYRAAAAWPITISMIASNPVQLAVGLIKNVFSFFWNGLYPLSLTQVDGIVWFALFILLGFQILVDRAKLIPAEKLLFLASFGHILSSAFLMSDGEPRVFSATIPFYIGLLAWGLSDNSAKRTSINFRYCPFPLVGLCIGLVIIIALVFGAPVAGLGATTANISSPQCNANEIPVVAREMIGAFGFVDGGGKVTFGRFQCIKKAEDLVPNGIDSAVFFPAPFRLESSTNLIDKSYMFLVIHEPIYETSAAARSYCATQLETNSIIFSARPLN